MTIADEFIETFKNEVVGTVFDTSTIVNMVCDNFNRSKDSINPADYCYNKWNAGMPSKEKRCCLFEYLGAKTYKYLGENYQYNGKVYHKTKSGIEKCVGEWVDGVFSEYDNEQGVEENIMFNKNILKNYVAEYKENFMEIRYGKEHREIYKWEAVEHFHNNWNIEAVNFSEMIKESVSKTYNLLTAAMFFPLKMLVGFAQKEPDTVRAMFVNLYDESKNLQERISDFMSQADALHKRNPGGKSHYQGIRAISVYLWLKYPEKYYIYQYAIYDNVVQKLEADYKIKKDGKPETLLDGYKFFDEIREELSQDKELVRMNQENGVEGFKDEGLTTLTEDVAFFIRCQDEDDVNWYPSVEEYNPEITVEEWKNLYNDNEVFDLDSKGLMNEMMLMGGKATCSQLAETFLGDKSKFTIYNNKFINLGRSIQQKTGKDLFVPKNEDGKNYWSILCVCKKVDKKSDKDIVGQYIFKLRDGLQEALQEMGLPFENVVNNGVKEEQNIMVKYPKNLILYGPPGTGKTYNSVNYAVAIVENKTVDEIKKEDRKAILDRFKQYKENGLVEFCTFNQSFGYEEFIEGIKPEMKNSNVTYDITPGIFKSFCTSAEVAAVGKDVDFGIRSNPVIWKISLMGTGENPVRKDCLEKNHIRIGYGDNLTEVEVMNNMQGILGRYVNDVQIGDVVVSCYTENEFDAIGVVTGDCQVSNEYESYKQVRTVNWLVKNIKEDIRPINDGKKMTLSAVYRLNSVALSDVLTVVKKYNKTESDNRNRVFIIDEINRGNISKIFGELITLIEDSKRIGAGEEMRTRLPYSGEKFGVPNNVYLLGTMNTADRSIALIDTALRRRFKFVEMQPDVELVDVEVAGVKIKDMLEMINRRIEVLYDREHTIGHSFFMGLNNKSTIADLAEVFDYNVIPLLKEYFYDDYERIAAVLGDNLIENNEATNFIIKQDNDYAKILNSDITVMTAYKFNRNALENPNAYKKIYE